MNKMKNIRKQQIYISNGAYQQLKLLNQNPKRKMKLLKLYFNFKINYQYYMIVHQIKKCKNVSVKYNNTFKNTKSKYSNQKIYYANIKQDYKTTNNQHQFIENSHQENR